MNSHLVRFAVIGALALTAATIVAAPAAIAEPLPPDVGAGQFMEAEALQITAEPGSSCIRTYTRVRLIAVTGNEVPGSPDSGSPLTAFVDVTITRNDDCANMAISTEYGFANIDASRFQLFGTGLNGATVNATLTVCQREEFSCIEGTSHSITIDLAWAGTGAEQPATAGPTLGLDPGNILQFSNPEAVMFRSASITGTVVNGTTTLDFASAEGLLLLARGNEMTVLMGPDWHRP